MKNKLTRQGVQDLGNFKPKQKEVPIQCEHRKLKAHCRVKGRTCGHIFCPDCDLSFDLGSELNGEWIW